MHFFLTEILARAVGAYLAWDSFRILRRGFAEGKIVLFNPDLLDWLSYKPADRSRAPVQFWLEVFVHATILMSCVAVAIIGWPSA